MQDPWWIKSCCPLTCRLSLSMVTTILVSSHCTLRPTLWMPWCSSGSPWPQGRSSSAGDMGGGKEKGRSERRETAPAWAPESRRMESSGGNVLSRGSTKSASCTWLESHRADFIGREITQDYNYKTHAGSSIRTVKCAILYIVATAKMYVFK